MKSDCAVVLVWGSAVPTEQPPFLEEDWEARFPFPEQGGGRNVPLALGLSGSGSVWGRKESKMWTMLISVSRTSPPWTRFSSQMRVLNVTRLCHLQRCLQGCFRDYWLNNGHPSRFSGNPMSLL